jgi:hypothetical protein
MFSFVAMGYQLRRSVNVTILCGFNTIDFTFPTFVSVLMLVSLGYILILHNLAATIIEKLSVWKPKETKTSKIYLRELTVSFAAKLADAFEHLLFHQFPGLFLTNLLVIPLLSL